MPISHWSVRDLGSEVFLLTEMNRDWHQQNILCECPLTSRPLARSCDVCSASVQRSDNWYGSMAGVMSQVTVLSLSYSNMKTKIVWDICFDCHSHHTCRLGFGVMLLILVLPGPNQHTRIVQPIHWDSSGFLNGTLYLSDQGAVTLQGFASVHQLDVTSASANSELIHCVVTPWPRNVFNYTALSLRQHWPGLPSHNKAFPFHPETFS